ncbi:MAG: LolA-like putative outer membrane lipoprotein chaperone [Phocaeicola sp.]|uniref:LolA-like putative outer membrane lipoprotein chaperone n=1 Tax=Phocaeicola sp. TaxID=2773926 RepID=UPI003FA18061
MKKLNIYICIVTLLLCCTTAYAQQSDKAMEILDKTAKNIKNAGGINVTFGGSQDGSILLEGENFYLNSGNVECWFDGKTQWSYMKDNEEVNISNPTSEELQNINPYALLSFYKQGYNCIYEGTKNVKGKICYKVILKPQRVVNIIEIFLHITKDYLLQDIKIKAKNQPEQTISIKSYKLHQKFNDAIFKYDKSKYPNAEIIDLR